MSSSNRKLNMPMKVGSAITKYTFVKGGAADETVIPATAGAAILGIADDTQANTNLAVAIGIFGKSKLKLGGTVTRWGRIKSDSSALGVAVASDLDEYGAVALESGVSGDVISVLNKPSSIYGV